jgi:hypothetical protein
LPYTLSADRIIPQTGSMSFLNNHPPQIQMTKKLEALRQAETKSNTKHEKKDLASPPIFAPGMTNMQRLTATTEQVVNRLNYTLKIINDDIIKIITNWNITKQ